MSRALLILNGPVDRERACHWIAQAPAGTRIEFKAAKRTLDQNSLMWAALTDVGAGMSPNPVHAAQQCAVSRYFGSRPG